MTDSAPKASLRPLIGLPACSKQIGDQTYHTIGDKYVRAVAEAAEAVPLAFPALAELSDTPAILDGLDGIVLTGSPSNVHPDRYGVAPSPEAEPYDEARDATTLPLIRAAIAQGLPLLAICRGFQELNVALGGTLHARVHELPGRMDHRRPQHEDLDVQYGPRHSVRFLAGGAFEALAGSSEIEINSLHWQAIDRPAPGLVVEGSASDGTIEAVRVADAKAFALGVQWHPEYKALENDFSTKLFRAFGAAARLRAGARRQAAQAAGQEAGLTGVPA